jgi:hypothetical protein
MLKNVAILAGIFLIAAVILMARFDKDYGTTSKGYDAKCVQGSEQSMEPGSLVCTIRPGQDAEQGKSNPPWWHKLIAWPEGITAWLIMFTLGAIVCQAWETREAAEATRASVQTQERAVALNVKTERPYLVISVESPSRNRFVFSVKNEGRTPARIESIQCNALMADPGGSLRILSNEDMGPLFGNTPQLLPKNGTRTFYECDENRVKLMRGDTFTAIYFYGRISYSNVLEDGAGGPYETKWLYRQLPLKGKHTIPTPDPRHPEHNTWT